MFRVDRVLAADHTDDTFAVPEDFDPDAYLEAGSVYRAAHEREVRIRYSPRISKWVRERAAFDTTSYEEVEGGGVVVRHHVADPHWVIGHALQYGAEAEILEPADLRALVREVARGLVG